MKAEITQVLLAAVAFIGAVLTGLAIPWLRTKTTAAQYEQLIDWTKIAVSAAEMLFAGTNRGEEKLQYVTGRLHERGLTFDEETVRATIEAMVWELKK